MAATASDICLAEDDLDEENFDPNFSMKAKLDRRSLMKRQGSSRRRRRSSARFLKIVPEGDDKDGPIYQGTSRRSLGKVYSNAIRMNAENRINASNSWSLNLIDHLDRFVEPEFKQRPGTGEQNEGATNARNANNLESGVNFTKASCTLDASVKIYSYRVDDVHLTSYKVLANLNRTNGNKKNKANGGSSDHSDENEEESSSRKKSRANANAVDTLEQNTANINIHKLDAAFDIDPLFHKMSKTFDEGGAKGLLLANLGVGNSGCNIVFDSSLDNDDAASTSSTMEDNDEATGHRNSAIEVSGLTSKIDSLLSDASNNHGSMESTPLVPQLSPLRNQYADLGKNGFVEETGLSSKRYASNSNDEAEADKSIHLEAIERSRVSQADLLRSGISFDTDDGNPDFGESGFDYGGSDGGMFDDLHDGEHRLSSSSFAPARASFSSFDNVNNPTEEKGHNSNVPKSQAIALLDAIASGDISADSNNQYDYFNSLAFKNLSSGNMWAGADHWKKMPSTRGRDATNGNKSRNSNDKPTTKTKGAKGKGNASSSSNTVSLDSVSESIEGLTAMLQKPKRGRAKNASDPLQLTKAMSKKYSDNDNLLPVDAGLGVREFITLFSRPKENFVDFVKAKKDDTMELGRSAKVVGFDLDTDDASGAGFDFGGCDDGYDGNDDVDEFVVPTSDDIRKVDKINIGYATVARKVDVKRLKRDLWTELEQTFAKDKTAEEAKTEDSDASTIASSSSVENEVTPLSFKDTMCDMQTTQSQADVTVPFYFICILHLCNEKGLALESMGLDDLIIHSS